jgi:hypothetical protein
VRWAQAVFIGGCNERNSLPRRPCGRHCGGIELLRASLNQAEKQHVKTSTCHCRRNRGRRSGNDDKKPKSTLKTAARKAKSAALAAGSKITKKRASTRKLRRRATASVPLAMPIVPVPLAHRRPPRARARLRQMYRDTALSRLVLECPEDANGDDHDAQHSKSGAQCVRLRQRRKKRQRHRGGRHERHD